MKCACGRDVEQARIELLDSSICSECAKGVKTDKVKGVMVWYHKTAPDLQVVSPDMFQDYRKYNPYGRHTGRGSGVHKMSKPIVKLG